MARLEIRLLGGFEVQYGGQTIAGFESQKVRGLFAYLLLNQERPHNRDRLAGLLWPERSDNAGRRNVRQALYNLRNTLPDLEPPPVLTTRQLIQFNRAADYWLDVEAFEEGLRGGMSEDGTLEEPERLAEAVGLYHGDLLAGFYVEGSPEFEEWLLYEQERLRETAIQTLDVLVEHSLSNKAYGLGIRYGRQLVELDPLYEEAHRLLMRLYALAGRRSSALAQYEECRSLLETKLGVEPLEETTALYQSVAAEEWPARVPTAVGTAAPPLPLLGRDQAFLRLERTWDDVNNGKARLTLVEGETGIGKTRLVESFLRDVVFPAGVTVLWGASSCLDQKIGCQPLAQALRHTVMNREELVEAVFAELATSGASQMVRLLPEGTVQGTKLPKPPLDSRPDLREVFESVARFLEGLQRAAGSSLVLFLDDVHRADPSRLELLTYLSRALAEVPIWVIATYQGDALSEKEASALPQRSPDLDGEVELLTLGRLDEVVLEEIAETLVGGNRREELARFLQRESGGLPLAVRELINDLWDEGILEQDGDDGWRLTQPLSSRTTPAPDDLRELIDRRVRRLPASARRLLTLAAVVGPEFEPSLLQEIEGERPSVVEAGIDVWLDRRLARLTPRQGPGREAWRILEFTHHEIRRAIYERVAVMRREVMHRQVAEALERRHAGHTDEVYATLAHHYAAGAVWDKAVVYLELAADQARRALADERALRYYDRALGVLDAESFLQGEDGDVERREQDEVRVRILGAKEQLTTVAG